jgi:hypothetical protein
LKHILIPLLKTKNQYIAELYTSKEFADALKKINPEDLREDLKQEIFVILCSKPEDEIINISSRGELGLFTFRIMWTLIKSSTSPFYTKFRKPLENRVEIDNLPDITDTGIDHKEFERYFTNILKGISDLSWYEQDLLKALIVAGSCAKVSHETLIPKRSIYRTKSNIREKLNKKNP